MDRRLFLGSMVAAVAVSVAGGWVLSEAGDDDDRTPAADEDVALDRPGEVQDPTIGTNAAVAGTALPLVDLQDGDGNPVRTADLVGRPLVINLWFSTCAPCKKELPHFAAVHAELGDRIRFVGVNPYDDETVNESFARERGVAYELLRDADEALVDALGVAAFPVTLFVDATGNIVRQSGELDGAELRAHAQELLG